jgi:excisionase family DNA binding protein
VNTAVDVLNEIEVAQLLGCAVTTVQDRARSGDLPGLKYGDGGWRFPARALSARLEEVALQQAAERRKPAQTLAGVLVSVKGGKRGESKRMPPKLPSA